MCLVDTQFAMPGCEIRVRKKILEMRFDGERREMDGVEPERALVSIMRHAQPKGMMFDVREAHYDLPPSRWRERAKVVARITRDYPLAIVCRNDQRTQNRVILAAQREMGGTSEAFSSRTAAQDWLKQQIR